MIQLYLILLQGLENYGKTVFFEYRFDSLDLHVVKHAQIQMVGEGLANMFYDEKNNDNKIEDE